MPGFPFGPIRLNTRAGLPLTTRVLVPAVRRRLAVPGSGAAATRVIGRKGIVPAMATPDARMWRRVRSVGFSFSLIACPCRRVDRGSGHEDRWRCHCGYIASEAEVDPERTAICHCTPYGEPTIDRARRRKVRW